MSYTDYCDGAGSDLGRARAQRGWERPVPRLVEPVEHTSPVLVGRDRELAALVDAVGAAPSLVVIAGEAGIGKSRLVRELSRASRPDGTLFVGYCEHLYEPLPLGPLIDVFARNAERVSTDGLSPVAGALAPLVPELADRLPQVPAPLHDQRASRHRVFRAAVELLARQGPATLVLEDLHWAESGTFDFLTHLVAHQPPTLSIVVTTRTEAAPLTLWETLARAPFGPALRLSLAPLDTDQVLDLARRILQVHIPLHVAEALHEKTGGIPFVLEELIAALREGRPVEDIALGVDLMDGLPVPVALRDVVLQRLEGVDPRVREVVGAAAAIDLEVDEELVAEATGQEPAAVAAALADALSAGLLQEQDARSRFRHALAQLVVYESLPLPHRRALHIRIARSIEARPGPTPAARLAHHYERAGDTERFIRYAEEAADQALTHGDDAAAARFLLRAAQAADQLDVRLRLAVKLGNAAVDGLAHSEAAPFLEPLLEATGIPPEVRGELRFLRGRLLRQQGRALEGYREIEKAVADLAGRPALQARALGILAAPDTVTDRHMDVHVARGAEAERAARRSGSPEVVAFVEIARASLLLELGGAEAWDTVDRLRGDAVLLDHPREHARACLNWAQAALHLGHLRRAEELLAEGRQVADAAEYLRVSDMVELVAAGVDRAAGRWNGLPDRVRALVAEAPGFGAASLETRLLHASMLTASGAASEMEAYLRDIAGASERAGAVWPLLSSRILLARLLLALDEPARSADAADAALAAARLKGNWVWTADAVLCLVDALAELGCADEARRLVAELANGLERANAPIAIAALYCCEAIVAGESETAAARLSEARTVLASAGLHHDETRVVERHGRWHGGRGEPEGRALLIEALHRYDALGAGNDVARVARTMRRLGLAVPYPWRGGRRSHGSVLSERERQVALLAAQGRTNREIATELFVSHRTVESHVSHALRKLGCVSRADLKSHPQHLEIPDA